MAGNLRYYPTTTREDSALMGRITDNLSSGKVFTDLGLEPMDPATDRAMICGSPQMLADLRTGLDARGFQVSPRIGQPGHYVFERAFVEK